MFLEWKTSERRSISPFFNQGPDTFREPFSLNNNNNNNNNNNKLMDLHRSTLEIDLNR